MAGNIRQAGALFGGKRRAGDRETLRLTVLEIARSSGTEEREGKPRSVGGRPFGVLRESARTERGRVTFRRSSGRRKAPKGKAHERWELKEALEDAKAEDAGRVAKP